MDIQEKAEQYAREIWGAYYDEIIPHGMDQTYGEIAKQSFIAGYSEAKRWIPVVDRLPELEKDDTIKVVLVKFTKAEFPMAAYYHNIVEKWFMYGTLIELDVTEWREI